MDNKIWEWFMYKVFDNEDGTVQKIPWNTEKTSLEKEETSFNIHKKYLWDYIPDTDFIDKWNGLFELKQEFISWKPVDIIDFTNEEVIKILNSWLTMQEKNKIFFDIFWLEWMIRLFNYYYWWTILKTLYDKSIPLGSLYLEKVHKLPKWKFEEMNLEKNNKWNPFVAHNMIIDDDWNIRFIDTDNRPLNAFQPLNMIWNWITKKALHEVKQHRYMMQTKKNLD